MEGCDKIGVAKKNADGSLLDEKGIRDVCKDSFVRMLQKENMGQ